MAEPAFRRKGPTVAFLAAMLVVHNAHRMGVVPLFEVLRTRFGTDYAGVGTLFSAYVLGYAVMQTAVGLFGDRFDARRLLAIGLTLSATCATLFALTSSYQLALVTRFLLGMSGAFLYTPTMKLGITLFSKIERGRVLGTIQAGAGLGIVGALFLMPIAVGQLGLIGGFLLLPALAAVLLIPAAILLPGAKGEAVPQRRAGDWDIARRGDFWNLLAINFIGMLASYGLLTWLPTYLSRSFGASTVSAGSLSALANISLLVSAPLMGMLADLRGGRMGVLLGGSALAILCYLLLLPGPPLAFVLLLSVVLGVSLSGTTAPLMLFAGERFGPQETARVVGLLSSAAQIGAALAGSIYGAMLSHFDSFGPIWLTCAALAALRLALFLGLVARDRATMGPVVVGHG